jgi:hypothetical protein
VDHLPPEAALNTAIRNATPDHELARHVGDPIRAPWSSVETLLATVIDEIRNLSWMYASAHSKSTIQHPQNIRRPGISGGHRKRNLMRMSEVRTLDPRLKNLSDDEIRALMASQYGRGVD